MGKYAIHFGLDEVDKEHYGERSGFDIKFGEKSAFFLDRMFRDLNFDSNLISPDKATSTVLLNSISRYAKKLIEGDTLVLSFCGHSVQLNESDDLLNSHHEDKGWVMHDRVVFQFELWEKVQEFKPGVRIVLIVDSCNTGNFSFSRDVGYFSMTDRQVQDKESIYCFNTHKHLYNEILKQSGASGRYRIPPALIIMASTPDNFKTYADSENRQRTDFSLAFEYAYQNKEIVRPLCWKYLFNEIVWQIVHQEIWHWVKRFPDDSTAPVLHVKNAVNPKKNLERVVIPAWHYYRGHKLTSIEYESI